MMKLIGRAGLAAARVVTLIALTLLAHPVAGQTPQVPAGPPPAAPQDAPSPVTPHDQPLDPEWPLKGRFLVGAAWGTVATVDRDLGTQYKVSPVFRWNSRRAGWGPSFGFTWYTTDIRVPVNGSPATVGSLKVRPVMLGVGYSVVRNRTRATAGLVGGYVFNSVSVDRALPPGVSATIDMKNAWAAGPKVDVMYAATGRIVLMGSVGYVYSQPDVTARVWKDGQPVAVLTDHLRGDSLAFRIGAAVSLF